MRRIAALALGILTAACAPRPQITPVPADAPAELVALAGAAVMIGAGDIASCGSTGDERTARIVDSIIKADSVAGVENFVFTLGDNAYPDGSARDFERCFTPSWGDPKKSIMKVIHPSPGNHEHHTNGAASYYNYFGERAAGSAKRGYYSYDVGAWKVIVINSEIVVNPEFPRSDEVAQLTWIKNEMKTSTKACTMAYFHHPRFSSGWHGSDARMAPTWQAMMDGGVDLVLAGHDHHYERLAPMNAEGVRDTVKGIPSFVVGTGGGELRGLKGTKAPNSEYRLQGYFGVLKLTLGDKGYTSAFIDTNGRAWDPVAGSCIQNKAPTPTPTAAP